MYVDVVCKNIRVRTKYKVSSEDFVETISKVDNIIRKSMLKSYCDRIILKSFDKKPLIDEQDLCLQYILYGLEDNKKKSSMMLTNLENRVKSSISSYFQRGFSTVK